MTGNDVRFLLFDLGGVLVTWKGIEGLRDLSQGRMSLEESRLFWLNSRWVREIGRGGCSVEEFLHGVTAELDFPLSSEDLMKAFLEWDQGPMPGARELLTELRKKYPLGCLSNNEEVHWNLLKEKYQAEQWFDRCYLSHEIGMIKPDPEIYLHVLDDLGLKPATILFFDDNPECVEGARRAGMQSRLAKGVSDLRSILAELELWPLPRVAAARA